MTTTHRAAKARKELADWIGTGRLIWWPIKYSRLPRDPKYATHPLSKLPRKP